MKNQDTNIENTIFEQGLTEASLENDSVILVVDDDRTTLMLLEMQLDKLGYKVITSKNATSALEVLDAQYNTIDVVLLDRKMPDMSGLEVVERMKKSLILQNIPVIMQTGSDQPEEIREGIDAGVYYYLTKPIDNEVLKSVLSAALREAKQQKTLSGELKQHKASFDLIDTCKLYIRSITEAESLSCFLANCYNDSEKVVSGLAELLINAVEHGNLGIGYDEKTELIDQGKWRSEVIRRADLPEHKNKKVEIILNRKDDGVYIKITDEGSGFEWRKYMEIDPARAQDNHGRGIAQANAISFDSITYNETGNEVIAYVSNEPELDW